MKIKRKKIAILSAEIIKNLIINEKKKKFDFILKELLENSCDAKSSKIIVIINRNNNYIQILDNGCGIIKNDLKKLGFRYYTNKISKINDLKDIKLYGYKGEGLYFIKLLYNIEISSKTKNQKYTWKTLLTKSSKNNVLVLTDTINNGTKIEIRNINLKKDIYIKYLYNAFKQIALANFNTHLILYNNNNEIFNLPKCINNADKTTRLLTLIKNKFIKNSINVLFEYKNIKLTGFITFGHNYKNKLLFKYLFINDRFIKSSKINDIIKDIINNINKNISLGYCLYLKTIFNIFDINLCSNKINVTFSSSNFYYEFFYNFINKYIHEYNNFFPQKKKKNRKEIAKIETDKKEYFLIIKTQNSLHYTNSNKILTILNNKIFFELDKKIYCIKINLLREKILINNAIDQFINLNRLATTLITNFITFEINQNFSIIEFNKFFKLYGIKINRSNKNIIYFKFIPTICVDLLINWKNLLNDLIKYLLNNITIHFSTTRFDLNIIKIIINNTDMTSIVYNNEIYFFFKELLKIKENDTIWFKKNCIKLF